MSKDFSHVGRVMYNAHPSSPLIIGDFQVMKGWKGNPDGGDGEEEIAIATGTVVNVDLDLKEPEVFFGPPDEVVLMRLPGRGKLLEAHTLADVQPDLAGPPQDSYGKFEIAIPSGAVVISIAYNATPEEGTDTSDLEENAFVEGETPCLPREVPTTPIWTDDRCKRDLAVVPVRPGKYEIENGRTARFLRCTIRRVGDLTA
jgi:hypothetical protein